MSSALASQSRRGTAIRAPCSAARLPAPPALSRLPVWRSRLAILPALEALVGGRKLGSYPRQNGLALALRELGRIERTLFTLDWLQDIELRRRVQIGLNKGEAKNALARAVFFNRLGELRDRSFENQRYRASGLNLVVAAIVLWNTAYLERVVQALRDIGNADDSLLPHLSPLGWEHINLTGDYSWQQNKQVEQGNFRPLPPLTRP